MTTLLRSTALAIAMTGLTAFGAIAGECPADKRMTGATGPVAHAAKDVSDVVLAAIDLGKEKIMLQDRMLRLRKLEIQPGGIVPWHSHEQRPAIIYIVQGEIQEFASNCAVPIVHKAGDVTAETHVVSHWWQNKGQQTVVLLSADILTDRTDRNM
jgi:quercetin dioxygenase-like cupin family protein